MKKFVRRIEPPLPWQMPVTILLGIFVGLAVYVFYVSKAPSYLGDNPETCINCHVMIPHYANWAHNSHGRGTTCNDCHVPHDNVFKKYLFKASDGLSHATMFTLRLEPQVIIMEDDTRAMVRENCIRCHEKAVGKEFMYAVQPNYHNYLEDRWCLDCHRETPHGRVNGLASTPNALTIQKAKSNVAGWLEKELRITNYELRKKTIDN
jgi:cytochrome c nitrite reductase small subunit